MEDKESLKEQEEAEEDFHLVLYVDYLLMQEAKKFKFIKLKWGDKESILEVQNAFSEGKIVVN